jgi:hypothetical protein
VVHLPFALREQIGAVSSLFRPCEKVPATWPMRPRSAREALEART